MHPTSLGCNMNSVESNNKKNSEQFGLMTKVRMQLRWIETNGSLFPVCYSIACSLFALGLQLEIFRKLIHISFIHSITVLAMHLDATYSCNVFNDWHVLSRSAILPLTHIFLALNWNNISDLAEWQMFVYRPKCCGKMDFSIKSNYHFELSLRPQIRFIPAAFCSANS